MVKGKLITSHRCEGCGLTNDHTKECSVHDLLDRVVAELDTIGAAPAPFLAPRYYDVRPRWVQRLSRWCRNAIRGAFIKTFVLSLAVYISVKLAVWLLT